VVWTAYDVGSAGYNQASSIGDAMGRIEGVTMRVIPAGTDVARQSPIAAGRAQFGALGLGGTLLSQEAVMEFAETEWGPQEVRLLGAAWADFNTGVATCAADTGIETVYDLGGHRISWVIGAPALNLNMTSFLAAGGFTWDDVEIVEFPSFGASARGVIENEADCYIASTNSGPVYELAESPRGYVPPALPHPDEDAEAWERFHAIAPYWEFNEATIGAPPVSEETPHRGATYGYPAIVAYASTDEELVYQQARMMYDLIDEYVDAYPGNDGFALSEQKLEWVVPYHAGAVRYFEEQGVWTDELEEHNQSLIRRQELLAQTWDEALVELEQREGLTSADFPALWMELRTAALLDEAYEPYWTDAFWLD
jgi:uncharacterized protein